MSLFIKACRTGNIEQVRQLLPSLNYKEINRTDKDGNTGLHLACIQDNYDLVLLILQSDNGKAFCSCTILNKQGLNAYKCVQSERIRLLFARPASKESHFIDTNSGVNVYQVKEISLTKSDQCEIDIPHDWNQGYESLEKATDAQFVLGISQAPLFLRKFIKMRAESEICDIVRRIIRESTEDDTTYKGLINEFNLFIEEKQTDHLLNLYTKHEALCKVLQQKSNAFTTLFYLHLKEMERLSFGPDGQTYRGMIIQDPIKYQAVINDYRWAVRNDVYVLETRVFQSTSKERSLAEFFIEACRPPNQPSSAILCQYKFPEKCFTAFDLEGISGFEDEQEVLILPFTLFKVTSIETVSSDYHIISLTNVPVPKTSLKKLLRNRKT